MSHLKKIVLTIALGINPFLAWAESISADFNNVDMSVFVDAVARTTSVHVINSIPLKGKVSIKVDDLTRESYLDLFRVIMRANGYSVQQMGNMLTIIADKDKADIYPEHASSQSAGELVTRSVRLDVLPVNEVITQLNTLSGGKAHVMMSGLPSGNILLLSGYASDVERFSTLAHALDEGLERTSHRVILHHADAEESARILGTLITNGDFGRGAFKPSIMADLRTNSLIINSSEPDIDRIITLIDKLDQPVDHRSKDGVVYLKYTSADTIEKVVDKLVKSQNVRFKNISVVAANEINAVVVSAPKEIKNDVIELIEQLDIRRAQVHVEAMIVEVADGDGINFGVQWGDSKGSLMQFGNGSQIPLGVLQNAMQLAKDQAGSTIINDNGNTTVNPATKGDLSALMGLFSNYNGAALSVVRGNWMALVQAMKSSSRANIISTPSLTTLDNQPASFMVGQNVAILTGSTASADNKTPFQTVDRRDVGTKLTIHPQINDGGFVQLKISAEVSKVEGNTGLDVSFAERKLETTVLLNDGSMIVLGGLIDHQEDETRYKVPLLGDIPLIGHLFSSHSKQIQKRNLMIFIRPTILRDGLQADGVTQKKYGYIHAQNLINEPEADIGGNYVVRPAELAAFHTTEVE
jgi:general secretion pathway protein D